VLALNSVEAWYGHTQALFGVDLSLQPGKTVALVGTNGAGKSTTLRALLGAVKTQGSVTVDGTEISRLPTHRRVNDYGIAVVHEGRGLLGQLTVLENLVVGATSPVRQAEVRHHF
jgi:branched-chain amino acid transport system ATP-binding protein